MNQGDVICKRRTKCFCNLNCENRNPLKGLDYSSDFMWHLLLGGLFEFGSIVIVIFYDNYAVSLPPEKHVAKGPTRALDVPFLGEKLE